MVGILEEIAVVISEVICAGILAETLVVSLVVIHGVIHVVICGTGGSRGLLEVVVWEEGTFRLLEEGMDIMTGGDRHTLLALEAATIQG